MDGEFKTNNLEFISDLYEYSETNIDSSDLANHANNKLDEKLRLSANDAHESIIFKKYVELKSCKKVADYFNIPKKHVFLVVKKTKEELSEWGSYDPEYYEKYPDEKYHCKYPDEVIEKFKEGVKILKQAEVYAQRIDWLLSGDDGDETFLERLKEDLDKLYICRTWSYDLDNFVSVDYIRKIEQQCQYTFNPSYVYINNIMAVKLIYIYNKINYLSSCITVSQMRTS